MGNMLESDSSGNSDIEIIEDKSPVRTAGDGMESMNISSKDSNSIVAVNDSKILFEISAVGPTEINSPFQINLSNTQTVIRPEISAIENVGNRISRSSSVNSFSSKEIQKSSVASTSPKQLPAKNLLIPVKLVRFKPNPNDDKAVSSSSSYDKFASGGVGKQKNPKFVPYEPYACAIRPMMDASKQHTRKPSDTSSVVSQISTRSTSDQSSSVTVRSTVTSTELEATVISPITPILNVETRINKTRHDPENSNHQNSTALMKERLKMFEKEVNELQTENSRLKRMLIDSLAGTPTQTASIMNKNLANGNAHRISESFDNLNDEIEVWRSKFLSSCVLVEQLNKDSQTMNESVQTAAEILTDLKHSLSLTPRQYENVNEWFRQGKPLIRTISLPDSNYNDDRE